MTSKSSFPPVIYKGSHRKPKENKLKWYLILAFSIVFVVIAVTVIALTIYLTSENETPGKTDELSVSDESNKDTLTNIFRSSTTTHQPTKPTTEILTTKHLQTDMPKSTTTSTTKPTTGKETKITDTPSSQLMTTMLPLTTKPQTTRTDTSNPTSKKYSSLPIILISFTTQKTTTKSIKEETTADNLTNRTSTLGSSSLASTTTLLTQRAVTSKKATTLPTTIKQTSDVKTTMVLTTEVPTQITNTTSAVPTTNNSPKISLAGVTLSSASPFLLTCVAANVPGWVDLQIYREYGKNQSGLVAQMTAGPIVPTVIVIDDTLTFSANHQPDAVTMVLMSQNLNCNQAGNYSCIVSSASIVLNDQTEVKVISDQPEIVLPLSIVEENTMGLKCVVEFKGTSGDIKWTFSPPGLSKTFYDLSIVPETKNSSTRCTTKLESILVFTPGMYDNGSNFRCEVINTVGYNGKVLRKTIPFYVIAKSYCTDRMLQIHNHPYYPCRRIIYCSNVGPLVYEMDCPFQNQCYDAAKGQCVLAENLVV